MIKEVLLLHHTHTDIGYTHPQSMIWELHRRFIDQALDLCESTSCWDEPSRLKWTCECTAPLIYWLDRATTRQIDRFRALVDGGQIGASALAFHPTPLCPLTELARMMDPLPRLRGQLGLQLKTAICHDVNGLSWPITQVFRDASVELLITGINRVYGGYPLRRPMGFKWRGSDGHDVLVFNGEHYGTFHRELDVHGGSLDDLEKSLHKYLGERLPADYPFDFAYMTATHPIFVDNNPPDMTMANLVRRWNEEGRQPTIRYILPEELLGRMQKQSTSLQQHTGDWTDYWNFGCASDPTALRLHRANRARLRAAEMVHALSRSNDAEERDRLDESAELSNLFEEHTWTASCSISSPDDDRTWEQSHHKRHYVWQSKGLLSLAIRDQMEGLSGNPVAGKISKGLLIVNPSGSTRDVMVRVPNSWLHSKEAAGPMSDEAGAQIDGRTAQWQHLTSTVYRIDYENEGLDTDNSQLIGPIRVAPFSWQKIPTTELVIAELPESLCAGTSHIESPYYRLEFDDKSGRITSLFDKTMKRQLIDLQSPHAFFGYIHETIKESELDLDTLYRGREAFYNFDWSKVRANQPCWKHEWGRIHKTPNRLLSCRTELQPDGAALHLVWEVPGAKRLEQSIVLPGHRRSVQFRATLDKTRSIAPESCYFSFPLETGSWSAHYDTADLPVAFDQEQLEGSCRDWTTVGKWVSIADDTAAITLACPDAPMVQIGGFHFGKRHGEIDKTGPCLLLAWPINNYWMTNFPIGHDEIMKFRWELTSSTSFDPVKANQYADEASDPIETHPLLQCSSSESGRYIEIEGDDIRVLAVRNRTDDDCLIIDLVNVSNEPQTARIRLNGRSISNAEIVPTDDVGKKQLDIVDNLIETRLDGRVYQRIICGG